MKHHVNFTPGPSQLYFTVSDHARQAFRDGIPSLSHRSAEFQSIVSETKAGLQQLLNIPENLHIFFTGSATEIFERTIENLVGKKSVHLVNGAFSERFFETAVQLNKQPLKVSAAEGTAAWDVAIPEDTEMIAVTQNETSTGVQLHNDLIRSLKEKNPNALLVVDAVSSLPYPSFDFSVVDSLFFSVQKGFGLPAGLGVWIVNDKCIDRAEQLQARGLSVGSYHSLPSLLSNGIKNQTPETPNVLGIYLLNKVIQDLLRRGIANIRRETDYKAVILYQCLAQHPHIKAFVSDPAFQSRTVIVAETGPHTAALTQFLQNKGLFPGEGYGSRKKTQLRFANFPAHSKEQYEFLVDSLNEFKIN